MNQVTALQDSERKHHEMMERTISMFREFLASNQHDMRENQSFPEKDTKATVQTVIMQAIHGLVREATQQGKSHHYNN